MLDYAKLRRLRVKMGIQQKAAAAAAGMSPQRWSDLEHGRKVNVELGTLAKLAGVLRCPPCDLIVGGYKEQKRKRGR